ncbi:MAG: microtubule-binding protein [Bdellovibrionota bacterium]
MSFNYNKNKEAGAGDTFWTSYSDLFLGLSTIFLLLYVTASLRTGTEGLKSQAETQKLSMKVKDLESQLKMYESVKKDYLQNEASKDEVQEYTELMDKLTLLQEEAKDENEKLKQSALQHDEKQKALNKYQQMVRNVLNANKMAKTKIIKRNDIIEEQDDEIEVQDQELARLEKDVKQKQNLIAENERKIDEANKVVEQKMNELKRSYKQNKMTAKAYQARLAKIQEESEDRIDALRDTQETYEKQLAKTKNELGSLSSKLKESETQLANKDSELARTESEKQNLKGQLSKAEAEAQAKIAALKGDFNNQAAKDRAAFEKELSQQKMGAAEKARREAAFRGEAAKKEQELQGKIKGLSGRVQGLADQLKTTEGQLSKAKSEMDARREVAQQIKRGFEKAGVKADIDMQTGEVLLDFGQAYFDSDSARLKEEMKIVLEKAMPVYSKSLFGDPKLSKKISSVEVVGFASPTYKGKFIDPNSTKPNDKEAIKYNMDLSYKRAKSIFNHILDEKSMEFEYQKDLVPMMKVSGRSYLEVIKVNRNVASGEEFCKINDCKKSQRVIIRFNMDGKK